MRAFLSALLLCFGSDLLAQCPSTLPHGVTCSSGGGNTILTLERDAEVSWGAFSFAPQQHLTITSAGNSSFSSTHTVRRGVALVEGTITADGPFSLFANGGIQISGTVSAPAVTLSTLPAISSNTFLAGRTRSQLTVSGDVTATRGELTVLGNSVNTSGALEAPRAKLTIISAGSGTVELEPNAPPTIARERPRSSRAINRGRLASPVIEIYSEGTIFNSGQILTSGQGNRVLLSAARSITHDDRPGSVIETGNLRTIPETVLRGPIVDPDDGANLGGASTTTEFPDLASGRFTASTRTTLLPSQYSSSTVAGTRLPATLQKASKQKKTILATRGSTGKKQKKRSRKRSFFGTVTTEKKRS